MGASRANAKLQARLAAVAVAVATVTGLTYCSWQARTAALSLLLGFVVLVCGVAWVISTMMLCPPWLANPAGGHRSRSPEEGLVKDIIGDAVTVWRISDKIDGRGTPLSDLGLPYEDVEIPIIRSTYRDNQVLRGWFVPAPSAAACPPPPPYPTHNGALNGASDNAAAAADLGVCVVAVHGGGRDRRAFLRHVPAFQRAGCAVLLFDFEEHGISDGQGRRLGWGSYECWDVLSATAFAKRRGFRTVVACGTSMGAVGCILAAAQCATDAAINSECEIDAVLAENPFSTRRGLIHHVLNAGAAAMVGFERRWLLTSLEPLVAGLVRLRCANFGGLAEPLDAAQHLATMPLLLMHGTRDNLVPCCCSEAIFERVKAAAAAGSGGSQEKKKKDGARNGFPETQQQHQRVPGAAPHWLWLCEDGGHAALYNCDPIEWELLMLKLVEAARVHSMVKAKSTKVLQEEEGETVVLTHADAAASAKAGGFDEPGAEMEAT